MFMGGSSALVFPAAQVLHAMYSETNTRGEKYPGAFHHELVAGARLCPRCNGELVRVKRRLIDRVMHWGSPRYRYRCYALDCQWSGTLPRKNR
jgi:hypothetical protein